MNDFLLKLERSEMTLSDAEKIWQLDREVFEFPWSLKNFQSSIEGKDLCFKWEVDKELIAYGIILIAVGEAQLLTIGVSPDYQRLGVGKMVMKDLLDTATKHQAACMYLEVRESNHKAIALYKKLGFERCGLRRHYYPNVSGREHALVYIKHLN